MAVNVIFEQIRFDSITFVPVPRQFSGSQGPNFDSRTRVSKSPAGKLDPNRWTEISSAREEGEEGGLRGGKGEGNV